MLAVAQPTPSSTDTLDGIGRAFFASFDRQQSVLVALLGAALAVIVLVVLLRWVRSESRRERREQRVRDARHLGALAAAQADEGRERREWVRVAAHLRVIVQHRSGPRRTYFEECETQDLSGGGLSFLSHRPPLAGIPLHLTLDLGEKWPLALQGVVVHVAPSPVPDAPALVEVKLGPITPQAQEHLVHWVRQQELRAIAEARRGRTCACCGRPLADGAGDKHSTCAAGKTPSPASPLPV